MPHSTDPLRSFWLGGFESACHVNRRGERLDMVRATGHDARLDDDYAALRELEIGAAREGVRWRAIEPGGKWDFDSLRATMTAARRHQVQVLWTLCHYGWPDDLELLSPAFIDRFARYCRAVARCLVEESDGPFVFTPMNEISFVAWASAKDGYICDAGNGNSSGDPVKRQLVRAAIAGIEAIRDVIPDARILHAEPLIHVLAPRDRPDLADAAAAEREAQFEAWEMLAGRAAPELGGDPRYLDLLGVNFYHANQFEYPDRRLRWEDEPRDGRWVPLHQLLAEVHGRYGRPLVITETSHFGGGRARWIREIAREARAALDCGVPLHGVCLYPVIDRPDWDDPDAWHHSGLWDLVKADDGTLTRVPAADYLEAVREAQRIVRVTQPGHAPDEVDGAAADAP
jgi:beta-glucosidase/6-phospho-beta-glucosidase/beta-galactosidase